ncbi:PIN domain-containing protein [Brevundimonas sp.]|uniref:PIN domain-containing protein n=1 Tax=Brevundimonas sp. TaxID=1871086 RepID=UPI002FCA1B86
MPFFKIAGADLDLPRNLALLDTNVLVAYADDRDNGHEQALLVIDDLGESYKWLVAPPVIVESCGLLMSRRGEGAVLKLLGWLLSSPIITILPSPYPPLSAQSSLRLHTDWMQRLSVDYVDSYLMQAAHLITTECSLRPSVPIVTFDTSDFLKCAIGEYKYSLYDMRDLDLIEFN